LQRSGPCRGDGQHVLDERNVVRDERTGRQRRRLGPARWIRPNSANFAAMDGRPFTLRSSEKSTSSTANLLRPVEQQLIDAQLARIETDLARPSAISAVAAIPDISGSQGR
jgi:hypothetical protein